MSTATASRSRGWTCRRQKDKVPCGHRNPNRRQLCEACGGRRPARRRPAHMAAPDLPYEVFLEANGGVNACGICGQGPEDGKRLYRDHDHRSGEPRGLLCFQDNLQLKSTSTVEWLRAAADYLDRAAW